jgi:signal transduction histidine kinase
MPTSQIAPFRLLRWFAGLSAIVIVLIAWANAWVVSSFLADHLFQREAAVSRDFVQNVLVSDGSINHLTHPDDPELQRSFYKSIEHLSKMHDVLRTNVYGRDKLMLWSTTQSLVGQRFDDNDELVDALKNELVVHAGRITPEIRPKDEYAGLSPRANYFMEIYIPVTLPGTGEVVGVVELYKAPLALTQAVQEGDREVAMAAVVGALALFLSLFWLVRRADRTMREQHTQLLEAETMAAIGELASSVAHNIRNPLASIRSAAELSLESPEDHGAESARDIIGDVDRISARITELLRLSRTGASAIQPTDMVALLQDCVADHQNTFRRRQQELVLDSQVAPAVCTVDAHLLQQVLHSVLANASEAMPDGRHCRVRVSEVPRKTIRIEVSDTGAGITPEVLKDVFRPFFTTKPQGLGLGLPLAKRIVEGFGGQMTLDSQPGVGTTVRIDLPKA